MRTEETANDYATLADVIREVLDRYKEQGDFFDNMCCILATSPLLLNEDIVVGYERLIHSDFSSIVPIVQFSYPILRSYGMTVRGKSISIGRNMLKLVVRIWNLPIMIQAHSIGIRLTVGSLVTLKEEG